MTNDIHQDGAPLPPEWSHQIEADYVTKEPKTETIEANEEERLHLARRLDILSIDRLHATLRLQREQGGMVVHIRGDIDCVLQQACVVTLDPVEDHIKEKFDAWFSDPSQAITLAKVKKERLRQSGQNEVTMIEEEEDPEAIVDGKIDLGELVVQHLSLALNPYPHKDGVKYEYGDDEPEKVPDAFKSNPFEALKNWKSNLED